MSDKAELSKKLIYELGEMSSDGIAEHFKAMGVVGRKASPTACAVSAYMKQRTGYKSVATCGYFYACEDDTAVPMDHDPEYVNIPIPETVNEFINWFDQGYSPDLSI